MQCNFWKPCSKQRWQDELWFSIWWFFEQSAFVNIYQLWYWPTIHNLVSKICPKFRVLSSHFFEVNELLNVHWVKIVRSGNFFQPQSMSNAIRSIIAFKNSGISCLALIFNLSNPRTTILHAPKYRYFHQKWWWNFVSTLYTLTWTSNFHCFEALGVGPGARTQPHVRAWRMGVIIAIAEPRR